MKNIISIKGGSCKSIMQHCKSEVDNASIYCHYYKTIGFRLIKKLKS